MSAIAKRLREAADEERDSALQQDYWHETLLREAADEIDRLSGNEASWEQTRLAVAQLRNDNGALRASLDAAIRSAKLALFVIDKAGVMPNDSWQAGFDKDMAQAEWASR